jgi:hypothetical protein
VTTAPVSVSSKARGSSIRTRSTRWGAAKGRAPACSVRQMSSWPRTAPCSTTTRWALETPRSTSCADHAGSWNCFVTASAPKVESSAWTLTPTTSL